MVTMDPLAISISGIFLVGALIGVLKFVSDRPKREEMQQAIDRSVKPIVDDLKYMRGKVDEIANALPKRKMK
ncbi:MAG: hypothetical protein AB1728_13280 [Bacteroidota bacterium]